jgi:hypothetical protein
MIDVKAHSRSNLFRAARVLALQKMVTDCIDRFGRCEVLDVGGTEQFWSVWADDFDWTKMHLTCVNLGIDARKGGPSDRIDFVSGDARNLSSIADGHFDIAFSNSVIEHDGSWRDMMAMASEVRRVARAYYVQTPYFWFPVEPHARTPFIHWLPESIGYRIVMHHDVGFWGRKSTVNGAVRALQEAKLLDIRQFGALFPDAEIHRERFYGLTKSMIAIRRDPSGPRWGAEAAAFQGSGGTLAGHAAVNQHA